MNLISDAVRERIRASMPDFIGSLRAKSADRPHPTREAGYTIQNAAGDEAVVRIYDEIWWLGVNAQDLARDLDAITAPEIRVEINSPGGDVFDGIAIYNALRVHPARITTRVDGIAASIASVIAQAGDHRVMVASSQMMIHNAWGLAIGDHQDHSEMAELLKMQDGIIADIYASRSGGDIEGFRDLMGAETWLTAENAVELGLADEVLTPAAKEAPADKAAHTFSNLEMRDLTLADKITELVSSPVLDDVERLVANCVDDLTGAKRDGLVALRNRVDGLLNPPAQPEPDDTECRRVAAAKRASAFAVRIPV